MHKGRFFLPSEVKSANQLWALRRPGDSLLDAVFRVESENRHAELWKAQFCLQICEKLLYSVHFGRISARYEVGSVGMRPEISDNTLLLCAGVCSCTHEPLTHRFAEIESL